MTMIIELKDCEKWIESHKTWILKTDYEYACPIASYGAKHLLDIINEYIMPKFETDNEYLETTLHAMIQRFWDDELMSLPVWAKERNALQITFDMVAGGMDETDIIDCLRAVLDLDRDDKYTPMMIKAFVKYYNDKQVEDSAKIHNYEEILKGE